ncbi:MAG: DUF1294 domain-containing protein [Erysipelotrichaceae bacterium]|nr:DUF1294 domain-containing protein [Erysipelotrichaceae bacterium]MDY5252333.1 DUF1294 domain-containing protein [Erysipelotrichaceae bacterium]
MIIAYYLLVINILTFMVFGIDKLKAIKHQWRIAEKTLLLLSVLGGSIGALLGMMIFHHKVQKFKFSWGIPLITIIQILLFYFIIH